MKNQINDMMLNLTGVCLIKPFPKHSIRYCRTYFKSQYINAIEIGTFKGANAKDILDNLNVNKLYLIDPYKEYICENNAGQHKVTKESLSEPKEQAHERLKVYDENGQIKWIEKYSDDAVNDVPQVDYIYIDGEHSYRQLKKDLQNYYPKLQKSGVMAGHDIHIVGVLNAVQDFTRDNNLHFQVAGQDWWFIK